MDALAKENCSAQIRALGVECGDILLVHSSLRALGPLDGGAEMVLESLLETIGPDGTLMMPGFQRGSEYVLAASKVCFDVRNHPSECGYLTEFFRLFPGTRRSLSPTHSMTACGPLAEELIRGHEKCSVSTGWGSPFEKLIRLGGKILMLGAARGSNTTMHFLENTGGAPTVCSTLFPTRVIDLKGKEIETPVYPHMPGLNRNYPYAIDLLEKVGGVSRGMVGTAACELYSAPLLEQVAYQALKENPCAFIKIFMPPVPGGMNRFSGESRRRRAEKNIKNQETAI